MCGVVNAKELEALRARVREMEEEAEKIRAMQIDVEKQMSVGVSDFGQYIVMTLHAWANLSNTSLFDFCLLYTSDAADE